jgi:hypothetical protein
MLAANLDGAAPIIGFDKFAIPLIADGAAHIGMKHRTVIDKQNALVGGFIDCCIADDTLVIFGVAFVT